MLPQTNSPSSQSSGVPGQHVSSPWPLWLSLIYAAMIAWSGILLLSAPLPILLDRFIPDDAFYYFNTARIFAQTGFSSFDGLNFTNGYQPLWFLISVPVFWLFPQGGETPLRLLMLVQLTLCTAGMLIFVRSAGKLLGDGAVIIGSVLWLMYIQYMTLNGLETSLLILIYALVFKLYLDTLEQPAEQTSPWRWALLGGLAGALFLTRTDQAFLVAALSVALAWRIYRNGGWRSLLRWGLWYGAPLAALAGGYLLLNLVQTGHLMPVSGAAKVYYSDLTRQAFMRANGQTALQANLHNLLWIVRQRPFRHILLVVIGSWPLIALAGWRPFSSGSTALRRLWPFFFGATAGWLFYGLSFFGSYTTTPWYYAPQALLAGLVVAALARLAASWVRLPELETALAALLIGYLPEFLAWYVVLGVGLALVVVFLGVQWLKLPPPQWRRLTIPILIAVLVLLPIAWYRWNGVQITRWPYLALILVALSAFAGAWQFRLSPAAANAPSSQLPLRAVSLCFFFTLLAPHTVNLINKINQPAANWNFHLYQGALWARDNTPPETTVWSGSSGILGYFSERTVVNTDGLANSYEYLETVLIPNKVGQYVTQFDYWIDAFSVERVNQLPSDCVVALPAGQTPPVFTDGGLTRQLAVIKAACAGSGR